MDIVSFQQIFMKKVRVQSYQHIQRQIRKKVIESKNKPKKLESSPTKHFTESSFLLVSDPLEDLNFRFFGLSFFPTNFHEKTVRSYQHIQRQICKKKIESKNTPKKVESSNTKHFTESSFLLVSDPLEDLNFRFFGLSFFQQIFMKKVRVQSYQHIQRQI